MLMSVTLETSHSPIGPCGQSSGQSPFGDIFTYASTALRSSNVNRGENTVGVVVHIVLDIDPDEPANMPLLLTFELTQADPQSFCLKDVAWENISPMAVTLVMSHFEMSRLNAVASENMPLRSVMLDTSHFEMYPFFYVSMFGAT